MSANSQLGINSRHASKMPVPSSMESGFPASTNSVEPWSSTTFVEVRVDESVSSTRLNTAVLEQGVQMRALQTTNWRHRERFRAEFRRHARGVQAFASALTRTSSGQMRCE
jgi:hypothetical protein